MRKNSFHGLLAVMPLLAACFLIFSSCDSDELSPRLAKKALEDAPQLRDSCLTRTFETGYYEVEADDTIKLGQLQRAGVITYSAETVVEKRKRYSYSWYGSSSYTENVDHIFVTVELTEEGKKLEVTNKPVMRSVYEKALGLFDKKEEIKDPAYMSAEAAAAAKKAEQKEDKTSTADVTEAVDTAVVDTVAADVDYAEAEPEPEPAAPATDPYDTACAKVNKVEHEMLIANIKIVKVIDVFCPEEYKKNGQGECNFVYEFDDLTPFAWVFGDKEALHKRNVSSAKFKHTVDQGWYVVSAGDE